MRILIATPIYPPEAGGPSYYAKGLKEALETMGHTVSVRYHGKAERALPSGLRHAFYLLKTLPSFVRADLTILLDTMSVGVPVALMKTLFGGKVIVRTGGDFLWEHYVERTGEKILFSDFYKEPRPFTKKERLVFALTKFVLRKTTRIIFSTAYQRDVWMTPYGIDGRKVSIIENSFPRKAGGAPHSRKDFVCIARDMRWKNTDTLARAFEKAKAAVPDATLRILTEVTQEEAFAALSSCYCFILVSLGDISPNLVAEALSFDRPVILSSENGIKERIGAAAMYVDPRDENAIARAVVAMSDASAHTEYRRRATAFSYVRTYDDIAKELITLI